MEMLVTKFSKGKYRNEGDLFAEPISAENVKLMGEMIALQALRTHKKFDMKVADRLYIGLIKDLHHMGEIFGLRYIARTMMTSKITHGSATTSSFAVLSNPFATFFQYPAKFSPLMSKEKYLPAASVKPTKSDGSRMSHCRTAEYSVTVGVKEYSAPNSSQK